MKLAVSPVRLGPATLLQSRRFSVSILRRDIEVSSLGSESQSGRRKQQHAPKKRIFSGIQPTGIPHLGNYLGALRKWKQLQDEKLQDKGSKNHQLFFTIADLHALTAQQDPVLFQQQRFESYASLLAIGLDPKECVLFMQSAVTGHTSLMWILSTIASTGYLSRMTQWKSKLGLADTASLSDNDATEKLKLGLFSYPVLQAADILLYRPHFVPVGEDQVQHIEFTRTLARGFNAHYCTKSEHRFKPPTLLLSPAKRVMSLKEPTRKMSKSHQDPMSRILITDTEEDISKKIKVALTDSITGISYDPATRPGISNLIEILSHTSHVDSTCEQIAADNADVSMRAFKELVAQSITVELRGIRERFQELIDPHNSTLKDALRNGNKLAGSIAGTTMRSINQMLGLEDLTRLNSLSGGSRSGPASRSLKDMIIREQVDEENADMDEPDVLPQKDEGVDRPIAS